MYLTFDLWHLFLVFLIMAFLIAGGMKLNMLRILTLQELAERGYMLSPDKDGTIVRIKKGEEDENHSDNRSVERSRQGNQGPIRK